VIRDADIEMAEMAAIGAAINSAHRRGVCTHGSAVGYHVKLYYPEQHGLRPGQLRCRVCKEIFADDEDWHAAIDEALGL
jgi:hypothetical protein